MINLSDKNLIVFRNELSNKLSDQITEYYLNKILMKFINSRNVYSSLNNIRTSVDMKIKNYELYLDTI